MAHETSDAVQAAYRRTTYLGTKEQPGARVQLMNEWVLHCTGEAADTQ